MVERGIVQILLTILVLFFDCSHTLLTTTTIVTPSASTQHSPTTTISKSVLTLQRGLAINTVMHTITVTQSGTKTTLTVNGRLLLVTTNANIARAYAHEAEQHYSSSQLPYAIVPRIPQKK